MQENINCSSCSKENQKILPLTRLFEKLNELFSRNDLPAVGRLLDYWETEAEAIGDKRGLLEILNEKIGYYRRTQEKDKALAAVDRAFALIDENVSDAVSSATVYLNGATTMKAFGLAEAAIPYYERAEAIYRSSLDSDDYRFAALYNNMSSAFKDLGKNEECELACLRAIDILKDKDDCRGEIAVTLINLAHLYYDIDPLDERIYEIMDRAWDCLSSDKNEHNGDFAFICSKCHPSFGFFGYFERENELRALTEKIYAGN